jgi:hypothetical protein
MKDISRVVGTVVPKYVVKIRKWKTVYEMSLCMTDSLK